MGTTFEEIFEDWMLPIINDYKLDKLYITDKNIVFEFLKGFLKNGLTDFDCIKPLTYHTEKIYEIIDKKEVEKYITVFDYELDDEEKKIISEIAVAKYFKRLIQDVKARRPYMSQREFKKDSLAPIMKQNDAWYKDLVSEYQADIYNYNMKHLNEFDYWKDLM